MNKVEELQEGLIMKNVPVATWIGRAESIRVVWNSYKVLLSVLEELSMRTMLKKVRHLVSKGIYRQK